MLRQGRLTAAQRLALDTLWDRYGIDAHARPLDLTREFGRQAPVVLEIGSGMGQTTAAMAAAHPEWNCLAVEVHRPGVGSLLKQAHAERLNNIRVIMDDIVTVLEHQIPDRSLDEVHILFPDPWPKKRHHKRRLVSPEFLDLLAPKLKERARLFLATDWEDLAMHMLAVCDAHRGLTNVAGSGNFSQRPARPETKFEQRGRRLDHKVWDLIYVSAVSTSSAKEAIASNSQARRAGA